MASEFEIGDLTPRIATRTLKGVSFPAIIHNGSYFLSDLYIYEDGVVDCWGGVDLNLFREKVSSGWVKTSIPNGADLHIDSLGLIRIADAAWAMTPGTLIDRVEKTVTALNPAHVNLYDMQGDETDRSGPIGVQKESRMGQTTWRMTDRASFFPELARGVAKWAFWHLDDALHLVQVSLFDDDKVRITGAGRPDWMTLDALRGDERLCTATKGDRVEITGLCSFLVDDIHLTVPKEAFLAELVIDRDEAAGRETVMDRTRAAFSRYEKAPSAETLEALRTAYESVPEHLRRFCGDMDTKDIPIRIALYGDQEIEGWSHFQVSKARGEPLPSIKVPKPKDEPR